MVLSFTEEQEELRAVVRKFLESRSSEQQVRIQLDSSDGFDRGVWKQMAEQIGIQGLAIPEEFGVQVTGSANWRSSSRNPGAPCSAPHCSPLSYSRRTLFCSPATMLPVAAICRA